MTDRATEAEIEVLPRVRLRRDMYEAALVVTRMELTRVTRAERVGIFATRHEAEQAVKAAAQASAKKE